MLRGKSTPQSTTGNRTIRGGMLTRSRWSPPTLLRKHISSETEFPLCTHQTESYQLPTVPSLVFGPLSSGTVLEFDDEHLRSYRLLEHNHKLREANRYILRSLDPLLRLDRSGVGGRILWLDGPPNWEDQAHSRSSPDTVRQVDLKQLGDLPRCLRSPQNCRNHHYLQDV